MPVYMVKARSEDTQKSRQGEAIQRATTGSWAVQGELPKVKCDFQCDYVILGLLGLLSPPIRLENPLSQGLKLALSVLSSVWEPVAHLTQASHIVKQCNLFVGS